MRRPRRRSRSSRASHPGSERSSRKGERDDADENDEPEPEQERLGIPPRDDQATDALDHVRDRVQRRRDSKPVDADEVARRVHRGNEQKDEENRKERLDHLPGTGAIREERAERTERERDDGTVDEENEDSSEPRLDLDPGGD